MPRLIEGIAKQLLLPPYEHPEPFEALDHARLLALGALAVPTCLARRPVSATMLRLSSTRPCHFHAFPLANFNGESKMPVAKFAAAKCIRMYVVWQAKIYAFVNIYEKS